MQTVYTWNQQKIKFCQFFLKQVFVTTCNFNKFGEKIEYLTMVSPSSFSWRTTSASMVTSRETYKYFCESRFLFGFCWHFWFCLVLLDILSIVLVYLIGAARQSLHIHALGLMSQLLKISYNFFVMLKSLIFPITSYFLPCHHQSRWPALRPPEVKTLLLFFF